MTMISSGDSDLFHEFKLIIIVFDVVIELGV